MSEAKVREGDVIEGLFGLALIQYILKGTVDAKEIERKRKDIPDPSNYKTKYIKSNRTDLKGDTFYAKIYMELKLAATKHAFGSHGSLNSKNSISLEKKTNQMVKYFMGANAYSFRKKLDAAIQGYIKNKVNEVVYFDVLCIGERNSKMKGGDGELSKADVEVIIKAHTDKNKVTKDVFKQVLKISIKSEAVKVEGVGIRTSFDRIFLPFGLKESQAARYKPQYNVPQNLEDIEKTILIKYYWFADQLVELQRGSKFSDTCFDLFENMIFGRDLDDVIDFTVGSFKQITREHFNSLRKIKLRVDIGDVSLRGTSGGTLIRFINSEDVEIFKFRLEYKEGKFKRIICEVGTQVKG